MELKLKSRPLKLNDTLIQLGFDNDTRNKRKWYNGNVCLLEEEGNKDYRLKIFAPEHEEEKAVGIQRSLMEAYSGLIVES